MVGHGAKFGRKWEEAIAALLSQRNVEEAARAVGIGVNTLLRWQKVPEFAAAYREARRAVCMQSIARLQQASTSAVSILWKVMIDPTTPPAVKARVAISIVDLAFKGIAIEDFDARLTEVERAVPLKSTRTT
jgi:hypothetical protein